MKIGYLGAGTWGFCLASLLASNGHEVVLWSANPDLISFLKKKREHPKMGKFKAHEGVQFTTDLDTAIADIDFLVESVTSAGVRPVFEQVLTHGNVKCPIVITSKGIEQNSGLLLSEVVLQVLGEGHRALVGCLSGPSLAEEVIKQLPASVVCSAYAKSVMLQIRDVFTTPYFRIYPNADLNGVSFGGAMKNIIAIACGISDGLGFGDNTKAALMTRGLHEIRKLSVTKGCSPETLNGLSGMGDLCVTCLSTHSRNYKFGSLIAKGLDPQSAKEQIGMVVEGVYTCVSAVQLGERHHIPVPISEAIYKILYEDLNPKDAVKALLQRAIKEEHL